MNASPLPTSAPANENAHPVRLELLVTDAEVAHELGVRTEGRERDEYARQALRLGVLALRQASGALDAQTLQREGERLFHTVQELLVERTRHVTDGVSQLLGAYFDPKSGTLPQRLDGLTKRDGELETLLSRHLDGDRSVLAQTLARAVGQQSPLFKLLSPEQSDGIVAVLSRTVDGALKAQTDHVLREFSLNEPASALSRLLAEVAAKNGPLTDAIDRTCKAVQTSLTLNDPASPLSLLRGELRQVLDALATSNTSFQTEVRATLESFKARRQEAARTTTHGNTFEAHVGEFLRVEGTRLGDLYEAVGTTKGSADRKTGDHVLTLGAESGAPDGRIVCEAKARKGYTERDALEEIALARKNRDAQVGVVVMDRATAPEGVEVLRRVGCDVLVVWDAEDASTDLALRLGVSVARALCVKTRVEAGKEEADWDDVDASIEAIANQVRLVDEIVHSGQLVKRRGEKIVSSAERLRETLEREVGKLQQGVKGLRDGAGPS